MERCEFHDQHMISIKQIALIAARDLRKNQNQAEKVFWHLVKDKKFLGYKFLRQHPLYYEFWGNTKFFIVDFYCSRLKLIVEIDGGIHEKQRNYDSIRTEILNTQKDIKIIRFSN
jgi:very-short-patch-repair endonuclease